MSIATPKFVKPRQSYIICTSPRSGSWLLADGLQATKIAGRPREWFHKVAEEERSKRQEMPLPSKAGYTTYMDYVIRQATTSNGVFGLKCHWYQLELLPEKLGTIDGFQGIPLPIALPRLFPNLKFIWLARKNKIRQAISLDRARQTGAWWHENSFPKKLEVTGEAVYDPVMIDQAERHLLANEIGWQDFFKACNAKPLLVIYEDLVEKYEETIRHVLRYLELPDADTVEIPPTRVKSQSDEKTDTWMEEYLKFQRSRKNGASTGPYRSRNGQASLPPAECRRQIGQTKLLGLMDPAIVEMLAIQGVPLKVAETEVRRAANNPFLQAGHEVAERLRRVESLLQTYSALAKLDPRRQTIDRRDGLNATEFVEDYYTANRPVVLSDAATGWPELASWKPELLKTLAPDQTVEMSKPHNQSAGGRVGAEQRVAVPFSRLVDMIAGEAEGRNLCFSARYDFFKQADVASLFKHSTILTQYLDLAHMREGFRLGLEPADFFSRLRSEPLNVLVLQLHGQKRIKLVPSYEVGLVYNRVGELSEVDPRNPDWDRHSKFRHATVFEVELKPGEALFMPVGWWHAEQATGVNITLTFTNFIAPNHYEHLSEVQDAAP